MSCLLENGIYNLEQSSKNISSLLKVHLSYIPTNCFNSQGCFIFQKLLCKTLFLVLIPFSPALVRTFTHQSWPLSSLPSLCHLVSSDMLKFPSGNTYLVVFYNLSHPADAFLKELPLPLSMVLAIGLLQCNTS